MFFTFRKLDLSYAPVDKETVESSLRERTVSDDSITKQELVITLGIMINT